MAWEKRLDSPDAKRLRGRAGVERRKRWLSKHPACKHCAEANPPRLRHAMIVDHVIPLSKGGRDDESNLQSLCKECDEVKTAADLNRSRPVRIGADGWPVE